MTKSTDLSQTENPRVACMGASDVAGTALGHPRVWLQIDPAIGFADCRYCDRRFVLTGGIADHDTARVG